MEKQERRLMFLVLLSVCCRPRISLAVARSAKLNVVFVSKLGNSCVLSIMRLQHLQILRLGFFTLHASRAGETEGKALEEILILDTS